MSEIEKNREDLLQELERLQNENSQLVHELESIRSSSSIDEHLDLFAFTKTPQFGEDGAVNSIFSTAEEAARKKHVERFLALTKFTIDQAKLAIIWSHADGRIFYVNTTACQWLMYSLDELRTMRVVDINPEFEETSWNSHWQELQSKGMIRRESSHRRKNGQLYPVELISNYVQFEGEEYNLSFAHDISDRLQTRDELEQSQYFLEHVIESIQDGVCVIDKEFNIMHANAVMRKWYANRGSLNGRKCYEAFHDRENKCSPCPTHDALKSGCTHSELIPGESGVGIEWLEVFSYPIKDQDSGEITGVVEFIRDISERLRMERQLTQAQKMEAVGTLSGGIAHDFNNIMQAILGSIQLMLVKKDEDHEDRVYLKLIEKSVERARELTSRLLFYSRDIESDLRPVDLGSEMADMIRLLERSLPNMVSIRQICASSLPIIKADIVQIEQVILNLAINSGHAMPDGGKLTILTEKIRVGKHAKKTKPNLLPGEYVVLSVSDTGTGMDKDTLQHIYEPFFTTKSVEQGTGLGLSIVYGIVNNHGGGISCQSEIGRGTTFSIYFPAMHEDVAEHDADDADDELSRGDELVLVVDDEEVLLGLGCDFLGQYGYHTIQASSGEEALGIMKEQGGEVDLVILDLNMPGMGGYNCLAQMMQLQPAPKVIIASGYAEDADSNALLEMGARAFLSKPYQLTECIATVRKALDG